MAVNIFKPMESLPHTIFYYATSPYPEWQALAWGASFVLLVLVLALNIVTKLVTSRWKITVLTPRRTILETRELVAGFDGKDVVKGVSLAVPDGKITAVMGPSGCGKTTFMRCINRMHELAAQRPRERRGPPGRGGRLQRQPHPPAAPHRDGVPATQPVSDHEHLRQRRGRLQPQRRADGPGGPGPHRGGNAAPRDALGRGEGRAVPTRARSSPAASSSGCASRAPWP